MALTTTPSAMAVPSRAATKNTCTYANDVIRELARVERDATADDGRRYPATAHAWVYTETRITTKSLLLIRGVT